MLKRANKAVYAFTIALAVALTGCPYFEPGDLIPGTKGEHWLRFVQITDIHVVDEESPARIVTMDSFVARAWRPQEAYEAQVLDATIREINRIHYAGYFTQNGPIDFALVTGDMIESAQWNEFRWFMDTMDGDTITPDSGELDGPLSPLDPAINPNLPFKAAGLAKDIPWYMAVGNHDNLCVGNLAIDRASADPHDWSAPMSPLVAQFLGLPALSPPQDSLVPTGDQTLAVLRAGDPEPIDPSTLQLVPELLVSGSTTPDPARHFLSKAMLIDESFDTRSLPAGHGFTPLSRITGHAYYSFRPKQDVPVRVIVMDSTGPDAIEGYLGPDGAITVSQFEGFLKPEIRSAREAGEYVMVITHHPSDDLVKPTAIPCITPAKFRSYLASQPNILLHLCGHMHFSEVITVAGPHPYPEILTGSLIDYPQEARMIDIYYDREKEEFHIESTFVSYANRPTSRLLQEAYLRMTTDLFMDPESPEWVERVGDLDLSDLETYLQGAGTFRKSAPRRPSPSGPSTIILHRPALKPEMESKLCAGLSPGLSAGLSAE